MRAYEYDRTFFDYLETGARPSAQVVVPLTKELLGVSSVLDVGCGLGVWLQVWAGAGASRVLGIDGDYIDPGKLAIDAANFRTHDVGQPFDLGERFDLVQSLEVGEHVDPAQADIYVDNLVRHGDVILFSAAVPGQCGENHVNEQPLAYWRDKFESRGFRTFDAIRPVISANDKVASWYRFNTLLYVRAEQCDKLSPEVAATEIPRGTNIADVASYSWRLRCRVLRALSPRQATILSQLKHGIVNAWRRVARRH
jgi:2-polyprenyl-3-methyl-5-hydroxy-6-metoxy-1,4-benzoquinol methylase